MAVAYEWVFPALDVAPALDGLANVVKTVHWRHVASEGSYTASICGAVALADPGKPFTNYEDLTPAIVTDWVVTALGSDAVTEMQDGLAKQIENQKTPPVITTPPPWE